MVLRLRRPDGANDHVGDARRICGVGGQWPLQDRSDRTDRIKPLFGNAPCEWIGGIAVTVNLLQYDDRGLTESATVSSSGILRFDRDGNGLAYVKGVVLVNPFRIQPRNKDILVVGRG